MTSLRLNNISKSFGDISALSGVDLKVEDGEFCVLLGPSGCGKSTLLKITAGLMEQDKGTVIFDGQSVNHLSPKERDIAMVFQSYALYPHMTVNQNLGFGLRMHGVSKDAIRRQIIETARVLGIEDLLDRKPKQLSGGQRQRVAMGRALVRRPRLFLLDEPLSNLDARLRVQVRLELKRLHKRIKGTILYVTHDQVEAMTLGDKVVVMREGKIHQVDRPDTIYKQPADMFVATFIGSPAMNLFKGELFRENDRLRFHNEEISFDVGHIPSSLENAYVHAGIRPEDINIGRDSNNIIYAEVEMVSDVGAHKYIHCRLGKTGITVRASKDANFPPGEVIPLIIDPLRLHLFYKDRRV